MSTYELIEQAVLDALGILEPEERDRFEQALAEAPEGVRAQVRDEQARLLDLEHLLPEEQPRPELRDLVLSAVRAAMREEREPVAGRIGAVAMPAHPTFRPAKRVSRVWRAAAIVFGAATIAMFAATLELHRMYQRAGSTIVFDTLYDRTGAEAVQRMIFGPNQQIAMTPVSDTVSKGEAAVWVDPDSSTAQLWVNRLKGEEGEQLRLVVLDEEGQIVREVANFVATGEMQNIRVKLDPSSDKHLGICRTASATGPNGEMLFTSVASEL